MLLADRLPASALAAPFPLLCGEGLLDPADAERLRADFPRYRGAGFFPHEAADCGAAINALIDELTAAPFADAIGERLGIAALSRYPALVTLCSSLNRRHGNIHTDSQSKIVTALVYLNADWPHGDAGALRFLADVNDIQKQVAPQVTPVYGNLVAFRRGEHSFHGHLPFEGERLTIQIAWLADADALARKTRRGRLSRGLKKVLGGFDRWWKPRMG